MDYDLGNLETGLVQCVLELFDREEWKVVRQERGERRKAV